MNWLKEVLEASTIDSLLRIVNDYLLQHPDEYWSWIPREAHPRLVAEALAEGSRVERGVAEWTMQAVREALRLDYLAPAG